MMTSHASGEPNDPRKPRDWDDPNPTDKPDVSESTENEEKTLTKRQKLRIKEKERTARQRMREQQGLQPPETGKRADKSRDSSADRAAYEREVLATYQEVFRTDTVELYTSAARDQQQTASSSGPQGGDQIANGLSSAAQPGTSRLNEIKLYNSIHRPRPEAMWNRLKGIGRPAAPGGDRFSELPIPRRGGSLQEPVRSVKAQGASATLVRRPRREAGRMEVEHETPATERSAESSPTTCSSITLGRDGEYVPALEQQASPDNGPSDGEQIASAPVDAPQSEEQDLAEDHAVASDASPPTQPSRASSGSAGAGSGPEAEQLEAQQPADVTDLDDDTSHTSPRLIDQMDGTTDEAARQQSVASEDSHQTGEDDVPTGPDLSHLRTYLFTAAIRANYFWTAPRGAATTPSPDLPPPATPEDLEIAIAIQETLRMGDDRPTPAHRADVEEDVFTLIERLEGVAVTFAAANLLEHDLYNWHHEYFGAMDQAELREMVEAHFGDQIDLDDLNALLG